MSPDEGWLKNKEYCIIKQTRCFKGYIKTLTLPNRCKDKWNGLVTGLICAYKLNRGNESRTTPVWLSACSYLFVRTHTHTRARARAHAHIFKRRSSYAHSLKLQHQENWCSVGLISRQRNNNNDTRGIFIALNNNTTTTNYNNNNNNNNSYNDGTQCRLHPHIITLTSVSGELGYLALSSPHQPLP